VENLANQDTINLRRVQGKAHNNNFVLERHTLCVTVCAHCLGKPFSSLVAGSCVASELCIE